MNDRGNGAGNGPRVALITTDRTAGGLRLALTNYLEGLLDLGCRVDLFLCRDSLLDSELRAAYGADRRVTLAGISGREIFLMRRMGFLGRRLAARLRATDLILNNNNFLCRALSKSAVRTLSVCHSDKPNGLAWADGVICLSHRAMEGLARDGIDRNKLIYLPHYFAPKIADNPFEARAGQPPVVVAAGRLVAKKGFEDFIKAAALVRRTLPEVQFRLAGEGEERADLEALNQRLGAPVRLLGWVEIEELADACDLFCLTSRSEPFGYVLCEMMDHGVPCIATLTNGPRDILDQGRAGALYRAGEPAELAERIIELCRSRARRLEQSQLAFERIRQPDFAKSLFTARLEALLG